MISTFSLFRSKIELNDDMHITHNTHTMNYVIDAVRKLPGYVAALESNPDVIQRCLEVKYRREDDGLPALAAQELLEAGLQACLQATMQSRRPTSADCKAALNACLNNDHIFAENWANVCKKRGWRP